RRIPGCRGHKDGAERVEEIELRVRDEVHRKILVPKCCDAFGQESRDGSGRHVRTLLQSQSALTVSRRRKTCQADGTRTTSCVALRRSTPTPSRTSTWSRRLAGRGRRFLRTDWTCRTLCRPSRRCALKRGDLPLQNPRRCRPP